MDAKSSVPMKRKIRILLLGSGPAHPSAPASKRREARKLEYLGRHFSGHVVGPVGTTADLKVKEREGFHLHPFLYHFGSSYFRVAKFFLIQVGLSLSIWCRGWKPFQVIISPNPLITGLTAILLGKITGAKTVVEVNGNFESAFRFGYEERSRNPFQDRLKERISRLLIRFVLLRASMVKLLYSRQLKPLGIDVASSRIHTRVFLDYVPIQRFIEAEKSDGHYILLLGYPWYLKGVDILIQAFQNIADQFPDYRLKIVGWCPEGKDYFVRLADGHPRIELNDPVHYDEVVRLMCGCSVYVVASRTDACPRVLEEAMGARKPIVAADIDGVPEYIQNGYNGLLFERENIADLAEKLTTVLADQDLAEQLAKNGLEYVQRYLSEDQYLERYREMIEATISGAKER